MNTTPNLGLKKPLQTEFYNVDDFNYNSDTIDKAIHDLSENKQNKLSTSQMDAVNSGITSAKVSKLDALPTSTQLDGSLSSKANKSDITNISITGTTNNTGSTILAGTLFYLNGTLCKTLVDVASGATFTNGTNYSTCTMNDAQVKTTVELIPNILYIDKVGKLCILRTYTSINIPHGTYPQYTVVVEKDIPSGFRPIYTSRAFTVSNNKNIYSIEVLNDSNKLRIVVWSEAITTSGNYEGINFSIPYFTKD